MDIPIWFAYQSGLTSSGSHRSFGKFVVRSSTSTQSTRWVYRWGFLNDRLDIRESLKCIGFERSSFKDENFANLVFGSPSLLQYIDGTNLSWRIRTCSPASHFSVVSGGIPQSSTPGMDGGFNIFLRRDKGSRNSDGGPADACIESRSIDELASREAPAFSCCCCCSSATNSSAVCVRSWLLWMTVGRLMTTCVFWIRRPIKKVSKLRRDKVLVLQPAHVPSEDEAFAELFNDLSYPTRKRKPAKGNESTEVIVTNESHISVFVVFFTGCRCRLTPRRSCFRVTWRVVIVRH